MSLSEKLQAAIESSSSEQAGLCGGQIQTKFAGSGLDNSMQGGWLPERLMLETHAGIAEVSFAMMLPNQNMMNGLRIPQVVAK